MKKKTISIIGTGVIGAGWATRFLASGHNVKAYDPNKRALKKLQKDVKNALASLRKIGLNKNACLLYTSPSPRDLSTSRMPSSA